MQLGAAVAALVGGVVVTQGYGAGWALAAIGILLFVGSFWPYLKARDEAFVWFAVLEKGVLMPSSFTSVPGINTLGGRCVLPRSQITGARQLREKGGRAVMVVRGDGGGGVVAGRVGSVELTGEEQEEVLYGFVAALVGIGVPLKGEAVAEGVPQDGSPP